MTRTWEDPQLTGRHRLPMHAVPHHDRLPLDGRWRFQLLPAPDAPPAGRWAQLDVPGCWTMQDFDDIHGVADRPHYTNEKMPWPDLPPRLIDVIDLALREEPAIHFQTARAFKDALEEAL